MPSDADTRSLKQGEAGQAPERFGWGEALFLIVCVLTLFARFRSTTMLLGSYQDDFFYYLQVAKYIATTGRSTFNGLYLTNGYHPLWMVVLVCLYRLFHGTAFFVALQLLSLASALATYALIRRTLRLMLPMSTAHGCAFVLGLEALMLIRYGMEVTLTLPLAMLLVYLLLRDGVPVTLRRAAWLGSVASLLVLSRLDAALLVVLLCVGVLLPSRLTGRPSWRVIAGFLCGFLPLLCIYFGTNLHVFHLLTPVSGLAKQMKTTHGFSAETWRSLLPTDRMRQFVLLPELLLIAAGTFAALPARRLTRGFAGVLPRRMLYALLLFPLVHFALLSLLSDWDVWPWYFYSLTLAAVAACALLARALPQTLTTPVTWAYGTALVLYAAAYAWHGPNSITVYQSSQRLAQYMDAHPGVYMMGDQAGTTAYLSHQPVIQTEGLVMDWHFLQLMRRATPLPRVAAEYHANYYARIGGEYEGTCMRLAEPSNAGPMSPHMRGSICHAPLAEFYREADHMPIRVFRAEWIR